MSVVDPPQMFAAAASSPPAALTAARREAARAPYRTARSAGFEAAMRASNAALIPAPLAIDIVLPASGQMRPDAPVAAAALLAAQSRSQSAIRRELAYKLGLLDDDRRVERIHWHGTTLTPFSMRPIAEVLALIDDATRAAPPRQRELSISLPAAGFSPVVAGGLVGLGFQRVRLRPPRLQECAAADRDTSGSLWRAVADARAAGVATVLAEVPVDQLAAAAAQLLARPPWCPDVLQVTAPAGAWPRPPRTSLDWVWSGCPRVHEAAADLAPALADIGYRHAGAGRFEHDGLAHDAAARPDVRPFSSRLYPAFDHDTLGIGPGAISFVDDTFFQAPDCLSRYWQDIESARVPVACQYRCSDSDFAMLSALQQLLRDGRFSAASWQRIFKPTSTAAMAHARAALRKLTQDGLLAMRGDELHLTSAGTAALGDLVRGLEWPQRDVDIDA